MESCQRSSRQSSVGIRRQHLRPVSDFDDVWHDSPLSFVQYFRRPGGRLGETRHTISVINELLGSRGSIWWQDGALRD